MPTIPTLMFASGGAIPQYGVGTWKVPPARVAEALQPALQAGIRHIDTAQMYGNEDAVGAALESSGIPRADLFVTTKLNNNNHARAAVLDSLRRSLDALRSDYVDLFLIHWPLPTRYEGDYVTTWEQLLRARADGLARHVGVSNFEVDHIRTLQRHTGELPEVNQIEAHPYFPNDANRRFAKANNILVEAWSPLAQSALVGDARLAAIGKPYGKSAAQVALRWAIQRGDIIFPRSLNPAHIAANMDIFDFQLSPADVARIADMDRGEDGRQGPHPNTFDWIPD